MSKPHLVADDFVLPETGAVIRRFISAAKAGIGRALDLGRTPPSATYGTAERDAEHQRVIDEFNATLPERRALSPLERAIIMLAISEMTVGREEAEAQLRVATYGGRAHPGSHVCFMIDVPETVARIPEGYGSPVTLDVDLAGTKLMSIIDLFIRDGRLASVDLTEVDQDEEQEGTEWPELARIHPFRGGPET